jgi:hypothetical protein
MVTYGEITQKNLRVNYTKTDIEGYKVTGSVNYNKEQKIIDANGNISTVDDDKHVASFNVYGEGELARVSLKDCVPAMMEEASEIVHLALTDLANSYPQE